MKEPRQTFYLGSAVEIPAVISVATATSAKITILDPALTKKVDDADMTKSADKVYTYVYQSASTDLDGLYVARFKIVSSGKTVVWEDTFKFIKQTGT